MNKIKIGFFLLKNLILRKTVPLFTQMNITDRCNLNCEFCYNSKSITEMSFSNFKRIILKLKQNNVFKLTLLGGEPLLHGNFERLILFAKKNIPLVFITTNGTFYYEKKHILKKLDSVSFSINENFENGINKNFLKMLIDAKKNLKNISVSYILTKTNIKYLDSFLKFCKKYNVSIYFTPVINKENIIDLSMKKVFLKIIYFKKKRYPILNSFYYLNSFFKQKKFSCFAGKLFFFINSNGFVSSCISYNSNNNPNILDNNFNFAQVKSNLCSSCYWNCYQELNFILSLKLEPLFNLFVSDYFKKSVI